MKICLLTVGKTTTEYLRKGIEEYASRAARMIPFEVRSLPEVKHTRKLTAEQQKAADGELILAQINSGDYVVLLDERGREYTSRGFSEMIERLQHTVGKTLYFVVGGPYGFSQAVYDRADGLMALSKMTFPHEMVRLFFTEQIYRALAILHRLPYPHA